MFCFAFRTRLAEAVGRLNPQYIRKDELETSLRHVFDPLANGTPFIPIASLERILRSDSLQFGSQQIDDFLAQNDGFLQRMKIVTTQSMSKNAPDNACDYTFVIRKVIDYLRRNYFPRVRKGDKVEGGADEGGNDDPEENASVADDGPVEGL
jgi:hypothetical protein